MTNKKAILNYFGTQAELVRRLNIRTSSVIQWGDDPDQWPELRKLQIYHLSRGRFFADVVKQLEARAA